jgi:hypothetical protein
LEEEEGLEEEMGFHAPLTRRHTSRHANGDAVCLSGDATQPAAAALHT